MVTYTKYTFTIIPRILFVLLFSRRLRQTWRDVTSGEVGVMHTFHQLTAHLQPAALKENSCAKHDKSFYKATMSLKLELQDTSGKLGYKDNKRRKKVITQFPEHRCDCLAVIVFQLAAFLETKMLLGLPPLVFSFSNHAFLL